MTGIEPRRNTLSTGISSSTTTSVERVRADQLISIKDMQQAFDEMHKKTAELVCKERRKQIEAHNKKTNIIQPKFTVGDFVLARRAHDKGHKLNFRWMGPRRVVKVCRDLVYEV